MRQRASTYTLLIAMLATSLIVAGRDDVGPRESAIARSGDGAIRTGFTKLDTTGRVLGIQNQPWAFDGSGFDAGSEGEGTRWSCLRDDASGLVWEVKSRARLPDPRDRDWLYTWVDGNFARSAGDATGSNVRNTGDSACGGTLATFSGQCTTQNYVAAINASGLCGANDWRLPTRSELISIVNFGANDPAIDASLFPNTSGGGYWSSESMTNAEAPSKPGAWYVGFSEGNVAAGNKSGFGHVRLVRRERPALAAQWRVEENRAD